MCDYSLSGLPNRLAIEGEQLLTYRFSTYAVGMASPVDMAAAAFRRAEANAGRQSWWCALKRWLDPQQDQPSIPAVCIPPGARLRMARISGDLQRKFGVRASEDVTFVQLSASAYQYRDAIQFSTGRSVLLQALPEGVPFVVLSMGSDEKETGALNSPYARIGR
jgi:hypothetical protein